MQLNLCDLHSFSGLMLKSPTTITSFWPRQWQHGYQSCENLMTAHCILVHCTWWINKEKVICYQLVRLNVPVIIRAKVKKCKQTLLFIAMHYWGYTSLHVIDLLQYNTYACVLPNVLIKQISTFLCKPNFTCTISEGNDYVAVSALFFWCRRITFANYQLLNSWHMKW